jgi:hypothetical protein
MPATVPDELPAAAAAGAASVETVAATAARAAKVFLLQLPNGPPRLRGPDGVAARPLSLFRLPSGRPQLRPPDSPASPALDPLGAPAEDMVEAGRAGGERGLLGKEDDGAAEWETPLESSEALKGRRHKN